MKRKNVEFKIETRAILKIIFTTVFNCHMVFNLRNFEPIFDIKIESNESIIQKYLF